MSKNKSAALADLSDEISVESMKKVSGGLSMQPAVMPKGDKQSLLDGMSIVDSGFQAGDMVIKPAVVDLQESLVARTGGGFIQHAEVIQTVDVGTSFATGNDHVGASGEAHAGAEAGASAHVTIDGSGLTAGAEAHAGANTGVSVEVHVGVVNAGANAGASAEANAGANMTATSDQFGVGANAGAHAGVDAGGNVGVGSGGNSINQGGSVNAGVHAEAGGNGNVNFGDGKYGAGGEGGVGAGAGVGATATGAVAIGGVVEATGSAGVSVGAQVGASGEGHAGYDNGKINLGFEGEIKLIAGLELDIDITIDTKPIQDAAVTVANGVVDTAHTVANGTVDVANTVAHGATDAANTVANGTVNAAHTVANGAVDAANTVASGVTSVANTVASGVTNAANTVANGITKAANTVANIFNPGRVICTHFYRKGMLDRETWRADLEFTQKHLHPATVRGYQAWAIPYVRLMRVSPLAEKIMFPLAQHRAIELAYKMGRRDKGSLFGKFVRMTLEPTCFVIGLCVGEQDWSGLWVGTELEQKRA